jgi:uncharacterized protein (DUF1330 family)
VDKKEKETNNYMEEVTEQVDKNGVKYIVYQENPVDIDADAEVNI